MVRSILVIYKTHLLAGISSVKLLVAMSDGFTLLGGLVSEYPKKLKLHWQPDTIISYLFSQCNQTLL